MNHQQHSGADTVKFAIMSVIGIFLFMIPIPDGAGAFNIPLGYAINWLGGTLNAVQVNGFGLLYLLATLVITISFLGTVIAYVLRPDFIMDNEKLERLFISTPVYFVSKAIGFIIAWMVFLRIGPDWIIAGFTGDLMMDLISGGSGLMAIFIVIGIAVPILTDFGLMEFLGILIRKVVRVLFTLPGRSSIDLMGSWFSSSAASVIITRDQHEKGYYTDREASAICVNFTLVSLPFTFVVAATIGLEAYFAMFYLTICVTAIILAVIMPRIWPLRGIKDEYLPEVGKQIDEEVPSSISMLGYATNLASVRASKTSPAGVIRSGLHNWLSIFMDLIPVILAWGTIALIIEAQTPIFDWISWPFGWYMYFLQVPYAFDFSHIAIVGFVDMFLPAILLDIGGAPFRTSFILGALSIVQIIYMAETGILILKSKMSLNIGYLAIIFIMRTVIALPIIVLITWLLF